jgi:hypothetical protein
VPSISTNNLPFLSSLKLEPELLLLPLLFEIQSTLTVAKSITVNIVKALWQLSKQKQLQVIN